jgi:hypothetical protein
MVIARTNGRFLSECKRWPRLVRVGTLTETVNISLRPSVSLPCILLTWGLAAAWGAGPVMVQDFEAVSSPVGGRNSISDEVVDFG